MIVMKKTLLDSVRDIEVQAASIVQQAQHQVDDEMAMIQHNAAAERDAREKRATLQARSIIDESVRAAHIEASRILEDAKRIANKVHDIADMNRDRTLAKAKELLGKDYGIFL